MVDNSVHRQQIPTTWKYALIGVIASLPATGILIWLPDSTWDATIGGGAAIVGAAIAGALAVTRSADPGATGLRAGFLGGVLATLSFVLTEGLTVTWSLSTLVFFGIAVGGLLCMSPVIGLISGRIGGSVANRFSSP